MPAVTPDPVETFEGRCQYWKARVVVSMHEAWGEYQQEWEFDYMTKPCKRLYAKGSHAIKTLTLAPFGTVMAYKTDPHSPGGMMRVAVHVPAVKGISLFIQGKADQTPITEGEDGSRKFSPKENAEPYVVPYWYANTTPELMIFIILIILIIIIMTVTMIIMIIAFSITVYYHYHDHAHAHDHVDYRVISGHEAGQHGGRQC